MSDSLDGHENQLIRDGRTRVEIENIVTKVFGEEAMIALQKNLTLILIQTWLVVMWNLTQQVVLMLIQYWLPASKLFLTVVTSLPNSLLQT